MHERKSILISFADEYSITCVIYLPISFNLVYSIETCRFALERVAVMRILL
jgi:hypothetical protein